ncbi:uncharacterized protein VTP21DRAFT_9098 [Calcarisporiella thermophila]|uniref:uncharacterized protein n=1 Tax=Calcarisporiella thermophila TaxID=911321 RepID=UPI003744A0D3
MSMKVVEVPGPNQPFQVAKRPIPTPGEHEVLIKVLACGVCHSDVAVLAGMAKSYPRIPGHEVCGRIAKRGPRVADRLREGTLVGVGWHGGNCFTCDMCRAGQYFACEKEFVTGLTFDGGYAEYMIAREDAVAVCPEDMDPVEIAPLLCAGVTVYNGMRNAGLRPGDVCAIQGVGGLGHLAIQYARQMGFITVVLSTSDSKRELATKLGAHTYINQSQVDAIAEINKLGGANLVIATAPHADSISPLVKCLATNGTLLVAAVPLEPLNIEAAMLIKKRAKVLGWYSGVAKDSEECAKFSKLTGCKPMIKKYSLDQAQTAFDEMMANKLRFRAVIDLSL